MRSFTVLIVAMMALILPATAIAQTPESTSDQTSATGSALDILSPGEPDTVSVVAYGVGRIGDFWVIVRNNTDGMVNSIDLKVTIRDGEGKLIAVGDLGEVRIGNLDSGEVAVGRIGGSELDRPLEGLEVVFDTTWEVGEDDGFSPTYNLEFINSEWTGDRILGEFSNPNSITVEKVYLAYACLGPDGMITSAEWGSAHGKLDQGESTAFQLNNVSNCESYVVSGYGRED